MKKQIVWGVVLTAIAVVLLAVAWLSFVSSDAMPVASPSRDAEQAEKVTKTPPCVVKTSEARHVLGRKGATDRAGTNESRGGRRVETADQVEEEKLVDEFDSLTDTWMKPSKTGVSMSDVDGFVKSFRKIPKTRRDECIHRALNLIPDENVMLLAGVLLDKAMDRPTVETIYRDILNRDEEVKKPILKEIFRDKSHPCWSDTAWILDVTGETPKKE